MPKTDKGLTAAEFRRALKPLRAEIEEHETPTGRFWLCVTVRDIIMETGIFDSPAEARIAFVESLRWVQDEQWRV